MNEPKYRVAILLNGMTRQFRIASKSWFENLVNLYPNIQFDFFLYTWNVFGDYKYEDKDFRKSLDQNWISSNPLPDSDIEDLKRIYQPKILQIEDYETWNSDVQDSFNIFINKHNCETEPLRVFNGIFAQYYQVQKGFQAFEKWAIQNEIDLHTNYYDLIIRSRFDLEILEKPNINWSILLERAKTHILGLEQWDRYGMRGNWIASTYKHIKKYSEFYSNLDNFSVRQVKEAKLSSVTIPRFVFNYILADGSDPETMDNEEIFRRVKPYFMEQVNNFLTVPSRLQFNVSLIPETFLKYYIGTTNIPVYLEEFLNTKVVGGQKSRPI